MKPVGKRQWKSAITSTNTLTPTTRLALLALADEAMSPGGQLIKGIEKIARRDNSATRRLARYIQAAYEGGWLQQTSPGYRRHAATYIATIPEPGERQSRRAKGGKRMTEDVSQTVPERMTSSSSLSTPKKDDTLLSSHKETISASVSEHLAVEAHATGETTTTASASSAQPPIQRQAGNDYEPPGRLGATARRSLGGEAEGDIAKAMRAAAEHGLKHSVISERWIAA